jgi:hypothetical protein
MTLLDRIPLSAFVRLYGAIMLAGAVYTIVTSGWRLGWFSTPSAIGGLIVGSGLVLYSRWARVPAMLLCGYWLFLGAVILLGGPKPRRGLPLIIAPACALPVLWRWSEKKVWIREV